MLAYLGLGSNLGDRIGFLVGALDGLEEIGAPVEASPVYETEPVGGPAAQPPYLNLVARLQTDCAPRPLLAAAQELERRAGRERSVRFGPRTLDVDLLLLVPDPASASTARGSGQAGAGSGDPGGDSLVLDEPDLVVPHPRMSERAFVLAPLEDLERGRVPAGWREHLGGAEAVAAMVRRVMLLEPPSAAAGWRAAAAAGERA